MNLSILSSAHQHLLDFQLEVHSFSSFHDTILNFKGEFGQVAIQKLDFDNCHTWIIDPRLNQNILVKGISTQRVLQLCIALSQPLEDNIPLQMGKLKGTSLPAIAYSYTDCPFFQLDTKSCKLFVFHYTAHYFSDLHIQLLEQLYDQQLLQTKNQTPSVMADTAFFFVLQQVLSFPSEDLHRPRYIKAKTEELLVHFLKLAETSLYSMRDFSPSDIEKVQQAIELMQAGIDENLSDFQLAKKVGINIYTLKKKFKAYTGCTLSQFFLKSRMESAKRLLLDTDTTISQIATLCGYKNLSNFSETFKKYYGASPNTLRRRN